MSKDESINCPRCTRLFACKAGNIADCQCNAIQLHHEERAFIDAQYSGCLCIFCLIELQKEFRLPNKSM